MRNFGKSLGIAIFLSMAMAVSVHAEDAKPQENESPSPDTDIKITIENLQKAIDRENNESIRYLAFAKRADEEGRPWSGAFFRTLARAEQMRAERFAQLLKKFGGTPVEAKPEQFHVKSNLENLKEAMKIEADESVRMYPDFLKTVKQETLKDVVVALMQAGFAKDAHAKLIEKMIATSKSGTKRQGVAVFYLCPVCGNIFTKDNPFPNCPICDTAKGKFIEVK